MELVDEPHILAPRPGALAVGKASHVGSRQADFAGIRRVKKAGDVQESRFAGTRGRHEGHDLEAAVGGGAWAVLSAAR